MKIREIIFESIKPALMEGARIAHAEDLVFFEGSAGGLRAVNSLLGLMKNKDTLSIKWDGSPAIVAGRDDDGTFIMTDKSGFTAKGYNGLYKSAKEFVAQKRTKGVAEDYLAQIVSIWPIVESAFPPNFRGFILGDIMWFPGELSESGNKFVFTPNTVTYEVDKDSDLGGRIAGSKAGLAVHTFIAEHGGGSFPLKDTGGLNLDGPLCILGPEIKNEASLQHDSVRAKQILQYLKKNAKAIDTFLNAETLSSLKMSGMPDLLYNYVNAQTKTRDLSLLYEKFLPWVQSNQRLSKAMVQKVAEYAKTNAAGLKAIFTAFDHITELKLDIIHQLDVHNGPVMAHVSGTRGGEGYVNAHPDGPIKLVNRLGFSQANFGNND